MRATRNLARFSKGAIGPRPACRLKKRIRTSIAKIVVGAILLITGAAGFAMLAWRYRHIPHFGRFDDDAVKLVCAKSLAEGRGYRDLTEEQSARAAAAIARGSTRVHSFPNSAVIQFQRP